MLGTLPTPAQSLASNSVSTPTTPKSPPSNYNNLSCFLTILTPLLFAPHLPAQMQFLPALKLPPLDCGPTPPSKGFIPERDKRQTLCLRALEFMLSLFEANSSMVKKLGGWA